MATTDAPLKRLFERLDFAPKPRTDALDAILEHWQSKRGDALFPQTRDIAIADLRAGRTEAFIFIGDGEGSFEMLAGSPGLTRLLGPMRGGEGLNAAPNRRSAARLRRLFEVIKMPAAHCLRSLRLTTSKAADPWRSWSHRYPATVET